MCQNVTALSSVQKELAVADMMQPVSIQLTERASLSRAGEPLRFGVPLTKGAVSDPLRLKLTSSDGQEVSAQYQPMAHWPDGSIRWICIDTLLPDKPVAELTLAGAEPSRATAPSIDTGPDHLAVLYNDKALSVETDALRWRWMGPDRNPITSQLKLSDQYDRPCTARLDGGWSIIARGPAVTRVQAAGWWLDSRGRNLARFRCELAIHPSGLVQAEAMIHNPRRARHRGGLWDLGDPGSIYFGGMWIETQVPTYQHARLSLDLNGKPQVISGGNSITLHQESSGGNNWNSRNHINAAGQILPRYRGFKLNVGTQEPVQGLRASPSLEVASEQVVFSVSQPHFWQNFPSALEADETTVRAWLFPEDKREPYELQGGERKSQQVVLGYGKPLEAVRWAHSPLVPVIPPEHYEATHAFPWFKANQPRTVLDDLIQEGLDGPSNFFAKREIIDEYGWRNFGDIFADHETLYQQEGEEPFISHYNNQYDAIYGFARQFALTGDPRWFELMDDLARHVVDIDIYHTNEDRAEYNNGLFWHTDHYLDAHTATHRTFSRHNDTSSTPGQTGGGPGSEHCYTTGHLYHYWITGHEGSRAVVLGLTGWIDNIHNGAEGFLAQILALKKHELPTLKQMLQLKRPSPHRFAFTRGTGNYINALVDAHMIEPASDWLARAAYVIRQTLHPADNISHRNLLCVETAWSYLILLSSIARFSHTKALLNQKDKDYEFSVDALNHYGAWMAEHESPFLSRSDELEFANDTWAAQDIRKSTLMLILAEFRPGNAVRYIEKADEWLEYSSTALCESKELSFARLQVVLLQNYGNFFRSTSPAKLSDYHTSATYSAPRLSWRTLTYRILCRVVLGLLQFRPKREITWLLTRMSR